MFHIEIKHFLFFVVLLVGCDIASMSTKEVKDKVESCLDKGNKPWYTFKQQGKPESGVIFVDCVDKNYPNAVKSKKSSIWEDDTPVTAGGLPSMSGLPGGTF